MKKIALMGWLLLFSAVVSAQSAADSVALAQAHWQVNGLAAGAESRSAQVELFGSRQTISQVRYSRRKFATKVVCLEREAWPTSRYGTFCDAQAAINGSYFDVKALLPVSFVLIDGEVKGQTTAEELMRTNGVVAFRGRRMRIFRCDTADYRRIARRYRSALAAGPVLVERGKEVTYSSESSFYTSRHPRSLIGLTAKGETVFVVIDGRATGQAAGATIAEAAFIARQLGLTEALNLDGGGSSTLWTAADGVLNHPTDNRRFDADGERPVPNAIVAVGRKGAEKLETSKRK